MRIGEISRLLPLMKESDIVVGYRRHRKDRFYRRLLSTTFNFCLKSFFGLPVHDADSVTLYRREVLQEFSPLSHGVMISAEILIRAFRQGYRLREVEIVHHPRKTGRATGGNPGMILEAIKDFLRLWIYLYLLRKGGRR